MIYIIFATLIIGLTLIYSYRKPFFHFPVSLLCIMFFIPYQMGAFFYGTYASFGAMPYFVYATLAFLLIFFSRKFPMYLFKNNKMILFLFIVLLAYSTFISWNLKHTIPIQIFCNFLCPFIFYLLIIENKKSQIYKYKFRQILAYISIFLGLFAFIEFFAKVSPYDIFWAMESATENIFTESYRIKTTIGHPLFTSTVALMLLVSNPLTTNKNLNNAVNIALWIVIICSGSRTALVLALLYAIYRMWYKYKISKFMIYLIFFTLFGILSYFIGIFDTVIYRFQNDNGSAIVRVLLFDNLSDILDDQILFWGLGIGASTMIFKEIGINYIIENPLPHFYFNLGIFGIILIAIMIFTILKHIGFSKKNLELCIVTIAMLFSYISINNNSIIPMLFLILFWLLNNNKDKFYAT